jgi:hypothetical protein
MDFEKETEMKAYPGECVRDLTKKEKVIAPAHLPEMQRDAGN